MKKIIYVLLFVSMFCNMIFAQSGWVLQNPYPTSSMLFGVKFLNDNTGYMVGDRVILKTTNGGQSLIYQTSPVITELNSVWFTDANTGFIAGGSIMGLGNDGIILKTNNGGNTWSTVTSGLPMLWDMYFINATTGFVTGKNGTILKTVNAGQNWIIVNSSTSVSLWGIHFINDMTGFITGGTFQPNQANLLGDGLILKTINGGNSWSSVLSGYGNTLFCIAFPNQNTGYAGGADGAILKTTNGGNDWSPLNSGSNMYFFGLRAIDQANVTVCGANMGSPGGRVLRTSNGGSSWSCCLNPSDTNSIYLSVDFSGTNTGFAVGSSGKIIKTVNGGANWTSLSTSVTNNDIEDMYFINDVGYGVTDRGEIIKTTNGGNVWTLKYSLPGYQFYAVNFADVNTGFICGCQGEYPSETALVMKTTDGGSSWVTKFTNSYGSDYYEMYFADNNTGYVFGGGQFGNIKTTNGGNNWVPFNIPGIYGIVTSASFLNANTGYVTGGYGTYVAKTSNGGNSWNVFQNVGMNLNAIFATDQNTAYVAGEGNVIHKTTNSGQLWYYYPVNYPNADFKSIYFPNANTGFIVGENGEDGGLLLVTTNAGNTWNFQDYGQSSRLISILFVSANTGYISGHDGLILKTISGGIGITNISTEIPSSFSLYQNYPNPFNPTTNIRFDIQKTGFISIKIYDMLGREIAVLVNEKLKPGTYEADWDAANYPSGVYFYKLTTEGYTDTKKMILIK
jgi:photosystem II stability/assembly factor-like uncharacterized protein